MTADTLDLLPLRRGKPHPAEDARPMAPLHRGGRHRAIPRVVDAPRVCHLSPFPLPLPIIPHEEFGADCCVGLVEIIADERDFRCDECGARSHRGSAACGMAMESAEATCPFCSKVNEISSFAEALTLARKFRGVYSPTTFRTTYPR